MLLIYAMDWVKLAPKIFFIIFLQCLWKAMIGKLYHKYVNNDSGETFKPIRSKKHNSYSQWYITNLFLKVPVRNYHFKAVYRPSFSISI